MRGGFASQRGFVVALGIAFITLVLSANLINVLGFLAMNRLALRIGNELQTTLFTAFGVAADAIDRPRLPEAARLAQLDEFVMTLPHGYEQQVGDRGVAVSGGQRQRIGIARALYRKASVLLLDEATNALDGLTEHELMITLRRLRGRCTVVLIAHGMSAVRACDVIVGSGTYEGLLRSSAVFRRMAGVG